MVRRVALRPPARRDVSQSARSLRVLLSGADRRSLAGGSQALTLVRAHPALVSEVAVLAQDQDMLISMRAMDMLEKLAHEHNEWVVPYKRVFTGQRADSEGWEIRLQIVRALPLFRWTRSEMRRVLDILRSGVEHPRTFVRAWALDGFATFAQKDASLMPFVLRHLQIFERSGSKALIARARQIRLRLLH